MKRFLTLMAVLFTAVLSVLAQRTITGTVIDSDEQQGVIQATVALLKADSTIVANGVTNDTGKFSLTAPADGRFIVRVTYIGYKTFYRDVTIAGGKNLASQFKNGANASGKVAKKSGKIVVQAAKGWKITSVSYSRNDKSWSHSMSGGATKATLSIPAKFASGGSVNVSFTNTGTRGSLFVSYRLT